MTAPDTVDSAKARPSNGGAEKRKIRELTKHLRDLTGAVKLCLAALDAEMAKPSSAERGSRIAKISNALQMQNDIARRFGLGQR